MVAWLFQVTQNCSDSTKLLSIGNNYKLWNLFYASLVFASYRYNRLPTSELRSTAIFRLHLNLALPVTFFNIPVSARLCIPVEDAGVTQQRIPYNPAAPSPNTEPHLILLMSITIGGFSIGPKGTRYHMESKGPHFHLWALKAWSIVKSTPIHLHGSCSSLSL